MLVVADAQAGLAQLMVAQDQYSCQPTQLVFVAEGKKRFEDQLQAHPKLAAMIEAYDQKKQDLKAIKKGKGKSSQGTKKRRRQEESPASDDEVCSC